MIAIEKTDVVSFEPAIRGMRNPMNSWEKSDSEFFDEDYENYIYSHNIFGQSIEHFSDDDWDWGDVNIGPNDLALMKNLAAGGPVHAKYRRMIVVYADITAPLYWWKEFDTYKVGTVANSCSTMHKIHAKEFTIDDFSHEHIIDHFEYSEDADNNEFLDEYCLLDSGDLDGLESPYYAGEIVPVYILDWTIGMLNRARDLYLKTKDKKYWWQMIQLLPSSYNQKRTVMMNYEVLHNIYISRKDHKLDEWHDFCHWIEDLPYSEVITCE